MLFLRSFLYFSGSIFALVVVSTATILLFFLPLRMRYFIASRWAVFSLWWLRLTVGLKFTIKGGENIPKRACVIASNHQSAWETLAFQKIFPQQAWVLKKELLWIPIFGWALALTKPIVIDRRAKTRALRKMLAEGRARLGRNIFVVIFPEGTRQQYGRLAHYQNGAAIVAKHAGAAILPVFHNSGKFWPKRGFIKRPGTISVIIGKTIESGGKSAEALGAEIQNWAEKQNEKITSFK